MELRRRLRALSPCLVGAACCPVGVSEVVAGGQGERVGLAQDPLAVGEGALEQRDGLGQPPGIPVGAREVVAGAQGERVGLAQDPLGDAARLIRQALKPGQPARMIPGHLDEDR